MQPPPFIQKLIDAQANLNARNIRTGRVPLHEAANSGNLDVVKLLLDQGIPHLPRSLQCETPAQLAQISGHHKTADFLSNFHNKIIL